MIGLWARPVEVLDQARDRGVWGAALALSLLAGVIGIATTPAWQSQWRLDGGQAMELAGIAVGGVVLASLLLGSVTQAMARTLGGAGRFSPTVSMFVVVFWTTDLPRLVLSLWLPHDSGVLGAVTWTTWAFGYGLAVLLIRGQHHLVTAKAMAAVTFQMAAALLLLRTGPLH
ncbi:YIP1 family protein [Streptomyces sp. NPDC059740]|uniref:YIP1 family protein n=1 Tax=Streptomyces sp. NPDC059740 TaxID=3346926 RepID=UPI00365D23D5